MWKTRHIKIILQTSKCKGNTRIIVNDNQQDATILAYLFLSTDIAAGWYHGCSISSMAPASSNTGGQ